ncbi:tumor necrosis factor alpha-induced protein 2 isoform X2 [Austrofundulus limnaeus]|uniref:Tumor necrosis factor alpha-induced protein 2 isoform X2 n=1 Tax=Austrofundulus limnaeus TaxID=52670 RepID=A0A2I4D585_AUSLI|nr:PREDICTED: tumor necrosis factor alpha-induced protein 2-like isoform X2 [Austrofundulus limnaeus]
MRGGVLEENPGGARRRLPRLKIWGNNKQKNQHEEDQLDASQQEEQQQEEQLEDISRRLILREEELFSQDVRGEEEEDQLQRDFEDLRIQIWITVHGTFTSETSRDLEVLRSAMASIQQQEQQDRRWQGCPKDQVPVWRPQRWLSTHNQLLQKMVEARLSQAAEDNSAEVDQLSSAVKRQVCCTGKRVKDDLLTVMKTVKDCYPTSMDILNMYAGLYHRTFSLRLVELSSSELEINDCSYLLFWVNHCYPHEVLKHKDLDGHIKTACLGSLLLQDSLNRLEEQYLSHREEQVKLWLSTALKKEQESWLSGKTPELIGSYFFSPLAIDVIQVMNSSLTEFSHTIKDQSKAQRLLVQLENFLSSYRKCLEEFVKGNHSNVLSVIKAQLVCEQQLSDYISRQTGSLSEAQRQRCLDALSAVRDCGYRCFTCPLHDHTKACLSQLWTSAWADGSLPVIGSLLDHLNQQLASLTDLKPACRQSLFCVLYQNVVRQYVKKTMKTRNKNREQQLAGAQRMKEDAEKMDRFFTEEGCSETSWLCVMLCSLAEVLRLQDPASIQLEFVNLARTFPDLSGPHVTALLSLKNGLSAADIRSIRLSVEENRLLDASTNQRPQFFSSIKVKWIKNKIKQMGLKS